jgi:hypothetical protein
MPSHTEPESVQLDGTPSHAEQLPATGQGALQARGQGSGSSLNSRVRRPLPLTITSASYLVLKKMSRSVSTSVVLSGSVRSTVSCPPTCW